MVDAELLSAFDAIDPATLDYEEWFKVSAVMHDEGLSEAEWDAWNRRDAARYTERTNGRKWASIKGDGRATRKSVFGLAIARGWGWGPSNGGELHLGQKIRDGVRATTPSSAPPPATSPTEDVSPVLADYGEPEEVSELPTDMEPEDMLRRQLSCMFGIGERASIALAEDTMWDEKREKWSPLGGRVHDAAGLAHDNNPHGVLARANQQAGAWIRVNPTTGGSDADVTRYASTLIESDEIDQVRQLELFAKLHLPIRCVVDSGGKSMHAVCIIDAKDAKEYAARVEWLQSYCDKNGLPTDHSNKNPGRYTRLAGAMRGERVQRLVCESMGPQSWGEFRRVVDELAATREDPDEEEGPRIEFVDLASVVDEPMEPLDEVIQGLLPRERVAQIVAKGGSGKTFMGYGLGLCVASGREWLGFGCKRGRVLYVDPELHVNDIHRRVHSIANAMGLTSADIAGRLDVVPLRGTTATADLLDAAIRQRIKSTGAAYDLIIIDSINAILTGDENSAVDVRALFASMQRLTRDTGAACVTFHHTGKGGGKGTGENGRGSSVFLDGPDECMELMPLAIEPGSAADELLRAHAKTKPNGELIPATAWRMTFPKHRTGAPIRPLNIIFRHPLHMVDRTGELAECKVAGSSADYGAKGGSAKGDNNLPLWAEMDEILSGIVSDIHAEGGKATRAACLPILNERRESMGLKGWSQATFKNNTLPKGKLRHRIDPATNELRRLTDEELSAEGGTVPDSP